MSSIGSSVFSIARNALHAHQLAVQVSANNISNAEVEGYTRQRAQMSPGDPARSHAGWVGTGVRVTDVARLRDSILDISVRRESANASGFGVRRDLLAQVEGVFGEPSETGLAAGLDAFWSAWADLANDPTRGSAKSAVQQRGAQVASMLNGFDRRLGELSDQAVQRFDTAVDDLNSHLRRVAELNERILAAEAGGNTAGDLRDMRDRAVDAVARLAEVQVTPRRDGTYGITIGGATVVDGNEARPLRGTPVRDASGYVTGFALTERTQAIASPGGQLEGLMRSAADIATVRSQLDTMASELVRQVNRVHPADPDADPPRHAFFHVAEGPVRARNIALSAGVAADASRIRAGDPDTGAGDNSIARELSRFRDERFTFTLGGTGQGRAQSFGEFFRDLVTDVAFRTGDAEREATAAETLVSHAETRRQSANGVSVDEELILLMRHQQAYTAASKLIKTADEMVQALLQLV
jgi:flagellar hook-associated protein 1